MTVHLVSPGDTRNLLVYPHQILHEVFSSEFVCVPTALEVVFTIPSKDPKVAIPNGIQIRTSGRLRVTWCCLGKVLTLFFICCAQQAQYLFGNPE